jgi:DNA integrity scanning protein DisA with diadenylate cyclase activity
MAFTSVSNNAYDGWQGQLRYRAVFDGAGQDLTDTVLIDISTLAAAGASVPASVKVQRIQAEINGDYIATLEYDATTDQLIETWAGQTDMSNPIVRDYTGGPNKGIAPSTGTAGFVGDILLTTVGAAAGDELNFVIDYRRKN